MSHTQIFLVWYRQQMFFEDNPKPIKNMFEEFVVTQTKFSCVASPTDFFENVIFDTNKNEMFFLENIRKLLRFFDENTH